MPLRRYVATGRGGPRAIVAVLGASLAAGVAAGAIEGVVDRWFSLLVIFPLLLGLAAGGAAAWTVGRLRLRAPVLALVLGAAGGTAGYVAVHALNYVQFRSIIEDQMRRDNAGAAFDSAVAFDDAMRDATGAPGFRGYLMLSAEQGVSIKRMGASDKGLALTGIGAWIVWLCELLIAAGTAAYLAFSRAREPFCEGCEQWFGPSEQVAAGGSGTKPARQELLRAVDAGDVVGAAAILAVPPSPKGAFTITASTCPRCAIDAHCTLKQVTIAKRQQPRVSSIESWLMTKGELTQLTDAVARAQDRAKPS